MTTEANHSGEFPVHILRAAEEWSALHECADKVSDAEIQKDLGSLALRQFRNLHKSINGHLVYLQESLIHNLTKEDADLFKNANHQHVYDLALEQNNLVKFSVNFPPA